MPELPSQITAGFAVGHRTEVAWLFWRAFKAKLGPLLGPDAKAMAFLTAVADPAYAISATAPDGTLLGVAGYKTAKGSFIGGSLGDLAAVHGWFGALWRAPLLAVLERDLAPGVLLMDGIFVADAARGHGIGTRLLTAIKHEARRRGLGQVRLDVIDSNPRARALYARQGFVATAEHDLGPLRHLFGFRRATTMIHRLDPPPDLR